MPKNKVSEWSSVASNNTDIAGINIAEGCAPSGINNAIRELMAQVKDMQTGSDSDGLVVGGAFTCSGAAVFSSTVSLGSTATATTQSPGDNTTKVATTAFVNTAVAGGVPSGCILMWSGSVASIPSGWYLCNGSNGTPDLRNRFIVGAGSTYAVGATGGTADAVVVSHTHSVSDPGHRHTIPNSNANGSADETFVYGEYGTTTIAYNNHTVTETTGISIQTSGVSGTNQNLPPYYALCFIMKA